MNNTVKMILYSIQPTALVEELSNTESYKASWQHVDQSWKPAYEYMCSEMQTRGIAIGNNAPVWAWAEPKTKIQQLAGELLSEQDWERGVSVIELQMPKDEVVLSSYFHWNQLLDESLETGAVTPSTELFSTNNLDEDDTLQATLPYVKRGWIKATYALARK